LPAAASSSSSLEFEVNFFSIPFRNCTASQIALTRRRA
jgi:hypothetical protein